MSAVTYGESYTPAAKAAAPRKGWFARFIDHVIEARMAQAAREVELHLGYLPEGLRRPHHNTLKSGQSDMPFSR
jgi:hypothetical protein